jgi:hypothetical protein
MDQDLMKGVCIGKFQKLYKLITYQEYAQSPA